MHFERVVAYMMLGGSLSLAFPRRPRSCHRAPLVFLACGFRICADLHPNPGMGRNSQTRSRNAPGAVIGAVMGIVGDKNLRTKKVVDVTAYAPGLDDPPAEGSRDRFRL